MPQPTEQLKSKEIKAEAEKSPGKAEKPEEWIETVETLLELGDQTAKKIEGTSAEVIESGTRQIESAAASIGGGPGDIEAGKAALVEVQKEIITLSSDAQDTIRKTSAAEEKKMRLIIAESEPKESLPKIGKPMEGAVPEAPDALIPGVESIDRNQKPTWDNLVFVRATDHGPMIDKDGSLILETPYSGTKDKQVDEIDPRMTLSWTVNHHVRPHSEWRKEKLPFVILASAKGLVEANKKPDNFADVDSFWIGNMKLPENTVIARLPGHEIKIPEFYKGKIHAVDLDPDKDPQRQIADIVKQLGYTPIKGGRNYSKTDGVSEVFNSFSERESLESGMHRKSSPDVFEDRYSKLVSDDIKSLESAVGAFVSPDHAVSYKEAEELVEKKLQQLSQADDSYMKRYVKEGRTSFEEVKETFKKMKRWIESRRK